MKRPIESLYYVTDKNIYDALNQSKVDGDTIRGMFARRNVVCSKKTPREELSSYFSRLTHDFLDHQDIATKLGLAARREKTTSLDISNVIVPAELDKALLSLESVLKANGDVITKAKEGNVTFLMIKYSEVDYKQNEFRQLRHRDGVIELIQEADKLTVRSTQSDHITSARDELVGLLEKQLGVLLDKFEINLASYEDPKVRSKFFYDLTQSLDGFIRKDVTDVYVHKRIFGETVESDDEEGDVKNVLIRGNEVSRSKILRDLLKDNKYYIFRIVWLATETYGKGNGYLIEALFDEPRTCSGFTYGVRGVYAMEENGKLSTFRRLPSKDEVNQVARLIETAAQKVFRGLTDSHKEAEDHG
jgi:hypothetical protein